MKSNRPVIKSVPRQSRKNNSLRNSTFQKEVLTCLAKLYIYARVKRNIELKHRTNRDLHRKTNKNTILTDTSIIDLMQDFISKKEFRDVYHIPDQLLFLTKFHNQKCSDEVPYATFYRVFKSLKDSNFLKKNPNITFASIANHYNTMNQSSVTEADLETDYDTIITFLSKIYR